MLIQVTEGGGRMSQSRAQGSRPQRGIGVTGLRVRILLVIVRCGLFLSSWSGVNQLGASPRPCVSLCKKREPS